MIPVDVLFSLTGDIQRNSRALKQIDILKRMGYRVEVLSLGSQAPTLEAAERINFRLLGAPTGTGPLFFAKLHRLFKEVAATIPAAVYHASDLYVLPAMHAAARRHGGKLVYDARELYPHVASTKGRPWVRWFWQTVERRYIRDADAVFTVSESIADRIAATYGVERPTVLFNVPPLRKITPSDYLRHHTGVGPETVVVLHQGQIQKDRGCERLVDAMRDVRGAVLIFLGGGPLKPALQRQVTTHGLEDRIVFLDPVLPGDLLNITASADVGVTLLEDSCLNHRFALPNKLFEYLMAGLPVLASDLPEIRRVVREFDVGMVIDPADRNALVAALQRIVDEADLRVQWRAHTRNVFETFNWEKASEYFTRAYRTLLSTPLRS